MDLALMVYEGCVTIEVRWPSGDLFGRYSANGEGETIFDEDVAYVKIRDGLDNIFLNRVLFPVNDNPDTVEV